MNSVGPAERTVIDSWLIRRWLCWPWCALRGHRDYFWLMERWTVESGPPVTTRVIVRCSCGRRTHAEKP